MSDEAKAPDTRKITPFAWLDPDNKRMLMQDPSVLVGIRQGAISPCDAQLNLPRISMANVKQGKKCRRWTECSEQTNRVLCVQKFGVKMAG